ncbi:BaeS Signal transduction histidine kinase [Oxalobacteraceae bacterium]
MKKVADAINGSKHLPKHLVFLVLTSALVALMLAYLLQGFLMQARKSELAKIREVYHAALAHEIDLFQHALSAKPDCPTDQCLEIWSAKIYEEFSWVSNLRRLRLGSKNEVLQSDDSLGAMIKFMTINERVEMYTRPVYAVAGSALPPNMLMVYLKDGIDERYLRVGEISVEKLLYLINTQLAAEGIVVAAVPEFSAPESTIGSEDDTRLTLDNLGVSVRLSTGQEFSSLGGPLLISLLVATLSMLLIIASGLVVVEVKRRRRAEEIAREQEERVQSGAKLATLGEIASMLSHELNQPLAAIESFASAAQGIARKGSANAQLDKCIDQIRSQVRRADLIIRSVHGFLKNKPSDVQSFNLRDTITGLLPLIELQAARTNAAVTVSMPSQVWITADKTMVEQVVLNLARNGLEAMRELPRSRKILSISVAKKLGTRATLEELDRNPLLGTPHVEISVTDRGMGIAPEVREKLFMPFVSTKDDGVGIGLSICKSVAEKHQGHIGFADNPAGGTIFTLWLPDSGAHGAAET